MVNSSELSFFKCVVIAALLAVALTAAAQTQSRTIRPMDSGERTVVGGAHPMARAEFDRGPVAGSMKIDRAAIVFKLSPAQQSALDKLLAEQQDPKSPNYHKWLTPEQYAERFGMSEGDLAKVSAWLKSQGLTVDGFSRARTRVFFSGTAAQVASALRTEFRQYQVNGEMHFANATAMQVPAALSGTILSFEGLDDFHPKPRVHVATPKFTSHVTGNHFLTPGDFAIIYDVKPLYDSGLDGTGVSIAIVGQSLIAANNSTTDLDAFRAAAGLPKKDPQFVFVTGSGTQTIRSSDDQVESLLDLEWSGAVAPNANILFVFTGSSQSAFNAIQFAIDNKLAPIISSSYGLCEPQFSAGSLTALRASVQQANTQGQTVIGPSGDTGAADCENANATSATHGLAVDAPASIPEVTGLGGSEFMGDSPTCTNCSFTNAPPNPPFWLGTTGGTDTVSSAQTYIPEMAWNDTTAGGVFLATGGGMSAVFTKTQAPWQNGITPADGQRDVPDVSLNASPKHDGELICAQGSCVTGFRDGSGNLFSVGGTSVGAPTFAGIVAIINQAVPPPAGQLGQGNINPTLYSMAGTSAFHDITTGNNKVACTTGTTNCPSGTTSIGFSAGPGYDLVTGLGSVDAHALVTSWPGFVAKADFSVGGTPVTIASAGQPGSSTVTVTATNGFNGTVNLACVLTSASTTAGVTCNIPTSVSVNGNSTTANLTISTTAAHVVSGASASLQRPRDFGWLTASGSALLAGIFLLGVPSRRRHRMSGCGTMLLVFFAAGLGCGGGSSSSGGHTAGTPAGSYVIAVTATSGSLSHTANVAVTVQ